MSNMQIETVLGLDEPEYVVLVSKEGKNFTLPRKYVAISKVLTASLQGGQEVKQVVDNEGRVVLSVALEERILEKVVEYMNLRKGVELNILNMGKSKEQLEDFKNLPDTIVRRKNFESGLSDPHKGRGIPKEEADFMRKFYRNRSVLFGVIEGANYLEIESLLHIGCYVIACISKGRKNEDLPKILARDYVCPDNIDEEVEIKPEEEKKE